MSGAEGMMSVSQGIKYEEQSGTKVDVLFGQEMSYIAGAKGEAVVGMESNFNLGAKIDVGAATNTGLEFGAEVQWTRGIAVELAEEGGGAYHHAFAVTAGASKSAAFFTLNLFLSLSILGQAILVGTSLSLIKTVWAPETNSKGDITIKGNPGFFASVTTTNLFTGALSAIFTLALPKLVEKFWSFNPNAALSLNHSGYAFLGSSSLAGSAGLELSPTQFNLSFDDSQRRFKKTGHEVTSFAADGKVYVKGNSSGLEVNAPQINLETSLDMVTKAQLLFTTAPAKSAELFVAGNGSTRSSVKLQDDSLVTSMMGSTGTDSSSLTLKPGNAQLTAVSSTNGVGTIELDGANISIKNTLTGGAVSVSASAVEVVYGTNSIKVDTTGVTIANGGVTILAPGVPVPDAGAIAEAAALNAQSVANAVATAAAQNLKQAKQEIISEVANTINNVKRTIETQISKISTVTGTA